MSGRFSLASFLLHSHSLASFSLHCVVLLRPVPGTLANYEQVGKPARAALHVFGNTSRQVGRACRQVGKGKNKHPLPAARLRDRPQRREFSGLHLGLNWKTGDAIPITADGREDKKNETRRPPSGEERRVSMEYTSGVRRATVPRSAQFHYTTKAARPSPSSSFAGGLMIIKGRLLFTSRRAAVQTGTPGTSSRNPQQ